MMFKMGKVIGLAISEERGTIKKQVKILKLIENIGVDGDAHRGSKRQVSVLSRYERDKLALRDLRPGEAAENILVEGIDNLSKLKPGNLIKIGSAAILEVIQIGKEIHDSPVHRFTGNPVLPDVGVFCSVVKGGIVKLGDTVKIEN